MSIASPPSDKPAATVNAVLRQTAASDTALQKAALKKTALRDYLELTKPRILVMILVTAIVGLVSAGQQMNGLWHFIGVLFGTGAFAASASVLNQWLEQEQDALMPRTQKRPLPDGRLTSVEVSIFGWVLLALGVGTLWIAGGVVSMLVGLTTWFLYVWIYTPMKRVSSWNTAVGTIPGAMPVLIGWTAAGGSLFDWRGWAIASIVVAWQFPHFMAIAWLYKGQYQSAGYKMLTNIEPSGIAAGRQSIIGALILLPLIAVVMLPLSLIAVAISIPALVIAVYQLRAAKRFFSDRNDLTARSLLRSSLLFLPIAMVMVVIRAFVV